MTLIPARRNYLDWMRGLAVLVMIEAHVVDAWTRVADRTGTAFQNAIIVGGFGAPLFLFLAGVAAVLAAGSRQRRFGSAALAAAATRRRGWESLAWRSFPDSRPTSYRLERPFADALARHAGINPRTAR
jgi:uncharacterized membrane protein